MYFEIKVGSVTTAQRGKRILHSKGYSAKIKRIENPQPTDGCGYLISVKSDDDSVVNILKNAGIRVIGVEIV